jgi:hypothetical protein
MDAPARDVCMQQAQQLQHPQAMGTPIMGGVFRNLNGSSGSQ